MVESFYVKAYVNLSNGGTKKRKGEKCTALTKVLEKRRSLSAGVAGGKWSGIVEGWRSYAEFAEVPASHPAKIRIVIVRRREGEKAVHRLDGREKLWYNNPVM